MCVRVKHAAPSLLEQLGAATETLELQNLHGESLEQACRRGNAVQEQRCGTPGWGWLNAVQRRWTRSDRTACDESQTVRRFLSGSVRWSRPCDWNILHDYCGVRRRGEFHSSNRTDFPHAAMPDTKMLQIQYRILSLIQVWMYLFGGFFPELMDGG